jgi:hypothetical protein
MRDVWIQYSPYSTWSLELQQASQWDLSTVTAVRFEFTLYAWTGTFGGVRCLRTAWPSMLEMRIGATLCDLFACAGPCIFCRLRWDSSADNSKTGRRRMRAVASTPTPARPMPGLCHPPGVWCLHGGDQRRMLCWFVCGL